MLFLQHVLSVCEFTVESKEFQTGRQKKLNPKTSSSRKTALSNFSEEESNNSDQEMLSENSEDTSVDATKGALKVAVESINPFVFKSAP